MRVELSGKRISFPTQCTCCGEYPNADNYIAKATKHTRASMTREWQFPMCDQCQSHLAIYQSGTQMAGLCFGLGLVGAFVISWWALAVGIILAIVTSYVAAHRAHSRAEAAQSPTCATAGPPAKFVGWQGAVQVFDIPSESYATAFLQENTSKVVNLTAEARGALSAASLTSKTRRVPGGVLITEEVRQRIYEEEKAKREYPRKVATVPPEAAPHQPARAVGKEPPRKK